MKSADLTRLLDLYGVGGTQRSDLTALAMARRTRGWWESYSDVIQPDYAIYKGKPAGISEETQTRPIYSQVDTEQTIAHEVSSAGRRNEQGRFRVFDKISELRAGVSRVERQPDRTGPDRGQIEGDGLGALLHVRRHSVARRDPQGLQRASQTG